MTKEALASIVDEVTTSMFGRASSSNSAIAPLGAVDVWTGVVDVGQPPQFVVTLRCRRGMALDAAERMLGEQGGGDASAREVLAELTSMVGGNVKSLIGAQAGAPLGSPTVVDLDVREGAPLQEVHLVCGEEPFTVAVFAHSSQTR